MLPITNQIKRIVSNLNPKFRQYLAKYSWNSKIFVRILIENFKKPSNNNQNYETYGDPHFMVQSLGSDPICFDYNPPSGTQITLLSDPENGMIVTGKV